MAVLRSRLPLERFRETFSNFSKEQRDLVSVYRAYYLKFRQSKDDRDYHRLDRKRALLIASGIREDFIDTLSFSMLTPDFPPNAAFLEILEEEVSRN